MTPIGTPKSHTNEENTSGNEDEKIENGFLRGFEKGGRRHSREPVKRYILTKAWLNTGGDVQLASEPKQRLIGKGNY